MSFSIRQTHIKALSKTASEKKQDDSELDFIDEMKFDLSEKTSSSATEKPVATQKSGNCIHKVGQALPDFM